ncbi:6926_t:CDS:2 [Ambispora leptoticha]|uniref:6926_t:CDS:1 n=1 Tax=Ambispora leptoticha TaxID=144679 RepID=A0A9N8W394_9GLOM|nr:6926_t:CDS:2 [Ambispora leptoticha]
MSKNHSNSFISTTCMLTSFLALLIFLVLESHIVVVSATQCDPNVFNATSAPLQQIANTSMSYNITINGTVVVTDGCTFTVQNFVYYYAAPLSFWYGSNDTNPTSPAVAISNMTVTQSFVPSSIAFKLDNQFSFSDFSVLKLISTQENYVIAFAQLRSSPTSKNSNNNGNGNSTQGKSGATSVIIDWNLLKYLMIDPAIIEQRRIATQLGPCPKGGYHELRSHYTYGSLFWAFCFGLPRCFGYSRKKTVCRNCNATFEGIAFPEPGHYNLPPPSQQKQ